MVEALATNAGVDKKYNRIISNLYWDQKAMVEVYGNISDPVNIERGIRQGCVLSPILSNLYSEKIFKDTHDHAQLGIKEDVN